jgi:hypothetical protein
VISLVYVCCGNVLPVALYLALKRLGSYRDVEMFEVTDGMCPVDRDLLLEIHHEFTLDSDCRRRDWDCLRSIVDPGQRMLIQSVLAGSVSGSTRRNALDNRRKVRVNLEAIKIQLQRVSANASRPKFWAQTDWRQITKNSLEHSPELFEAIVRVLDAERALQSLVRRTQVRVWLWSVSGFYRWEWGPMPDFRKLCIPQMLEAYDCVRLAASDLARCYGEAGVAEDIAAAM